MGISLTRQGIVLLSKDDVITLRWPWAQSSAKGKRFHSLLVGDFKNFSDYWFRRGRDIYHVGASGKVEGFSTPEVLADWTRRAYPGEFVLVVANINPEVRIQEFWAKLPPETKKTLTQEDVCVFKCETKKKGAELCYAVPTDLGDSFLLKDGVMYDSNLWS